MATDSLQSGHSKRSVGVIGAGVMGCGVAQSLALAGHRVILLDVEAAILQRAKEQIARNLRFQGFFRKEQAPSNAQAILQLITFATDYTLLEAADFVIENATEQWEIKKPIYKRIDTLCPQSCIFATNTSAISITRLASLVRRPERVIGTHFMNPVPMKSMVEVIRGYHTSQETIAAVAALLASMGKEYIVVNDMPGFVTNRVLMLTINEAMYLLQDQVATVEEIDTLFRRCFDHKMGPLETADLIGLDTVLYSIEVLYESYGNGKYKPCPLLRKMVDAGLYGKKSGRGFYTYAHMSNVCQEE